MIGRAGANIRAEDALDHVGGYMACSDVTARDVQVGEGEKGNFYWQHFRSKFYPTFLPTGPRIVTPDEIDDLCAVTLRTYVNDELWQDSDISDLIFDIPSLITSVSECLPLAPVTFWSPDLLREPAISCRRRRTSPRGDVVRTVVGTVGELIKPVKETS